MGEQDIRWKQRFQNFERAFLQLQGAVSKSKLSTLEQAGMIQFYAFTFELAWKTMKDYLIDHQVSVKFPRDTIKEAFHYQLVEDGDVWMDMLEKRNLMSHTYDEELSKLAIDLIRHSYFEAISVLYHKLKKEQ
jgi:nucleotidyltransferase substrate binding protein (TIGR01987 family)